MAKKLSANKSQQIRDYKATNPDASPKEIAAALAGLEVSAQFVSTVLSVAKKRGGKIGKRGPKPVAVEGMSKAAAAREYITQNPTAKAKDVVEALAGQKIKISPAQVYGLMSKEPQTKAMNGSSYDNLIAAKRLVDSIGIDNARSAINVLAKLLEN